MKLGTSDGLPNRIDSSASVNPNILISAFLDVQGYKPKCHCLREAGACVEFIAKMYSLFAMVSLLFDKWSYN